MTCFLMAGYTRQATGKVVGDILDRCIGNAGLSDKEARGNIDKGLFSRMKDGLQSMDMNALLDEMPTEPLLDFIGRIQILVMKRIQSPKPAEAETVDRREVA